SLSRRLQASRRAGPRHGVSRSISEIPTSIASILPKIPSRRPLFFQNRHSFLDITNSADYQDERLRGAANFRSLVHVPMSVSGELEPFPRCGASRLAGETPVVRNRARQSQRESGARLSVQRRGGSGRG